MHRLAQTDARQRSKLALYVGAKAAVAYDVEMETAVVFQPSDNLYQYRYALLRLETTGKQYVYLALTQVGVTYLGRFSHTVVYHRSTLTVLVLIIVAYRNRYCDIRIMAYEETLYTSTGILQTAPKPCVVYSPDHLAAVEQAWKQREKPPYGQIGHLCMAMDYRRTVFQKQRQKPQRERYGCQTLEQIMETHIRNESAMITYAAVLKLAYKHTGERRMGSDKLDYVILYALRLRLGYVDSNTLGATDIEMGYYVEYFLHANLICKDTKNNPDDKIKTALFPFLTVPGTINRRAGNRLKQRTLAKAARSIQPEHTADDTVAGVLNQIEGKLEVLRAAIIRVGHGVVFGMTGHEVSSTQNLVTLFLRACLTP